MKSATAVCTNNRIDQVIFFPFPVQIPASRIVAAIFLELAFTAEIRVMLSRQSAPGKRGHYFCVTSLQSTVRVQLL